MKHLPFLLLLLLVDGTSRAQEPERDFDAVPRVRAGGWYEAPLWRRGADGQLELDYIADVGGAVARPRFQPLLGERLERGLTQCGALGLLALVCHGDGDLLAMTDAELHFTALGVGTADAQLRQLLAVPLTAADGPVRRAEVLDRMLAVHVLERRGCRNAIGELQALLRANVEPHLTARARRALVQLIGQRSKALRLRLEARTLELPRHFDVGVIVDHTRLPDLGWLTPLGRRLVALELARVVGGRGLSPAMKNGMQVACDVVGELPFGTALAYGNARLDHSCLLVSLRDGAALPFALTWQAAGEFEHERWQGHAMPEAVARNNPLFTGTLVVEPTRLKATVGDPGDVAPQPERAQELMLDTGLAIRVVVPAGSSLWALPALRGMPPATGAELRVAFGEPGVIVLMVEAADDAAAEAWVAKGRELSAALAALADEALPPAVRQHPDAQRLLAAVVGASFSVKDTAAFATVELGGVTPAVVRSIVEAWWAE